MVKTLFLIPSVLAWREPNHLPEGSHSRCVMVDDLHGAGSPQPPLSIMSSSQSVLHGPDHSEVSCPEQSHHRLLLRGYTVCLSLTWETFESNLSLSDSQLSLLSRQTFLMEIGPPPPPPCQLTMLLVLCGHDRVLHKDVRHNHVQCTVRTLSTKSTSSIPDPV